MTECDSKGDENPNKCNEKDWYSWVAAATLLSVCFALFLGVLKFSLFNKDIKDLSLQLQCWEKRVDTLLQQPYPYSSQFTQPSSSTHEDDPCFWCSSLFVESRGKSCKVSLLPGAWFLPPPLPQLRRSERAPQPFSSPR